MTAGFSWFSKTMWIASTLRRKLVDQPLEDQLRFETFLSEQTAAFSRVLAADVDREIKQSLRRIVDFLKVDWGSLAEFSPDSQTAQITHAWVAEGAAPAPSAVRLAGLPWVVARLREGEVVRFSRVEELPEEKAALDRRTYLGLGIKSQVDVPLKVAGRVVGALAFSTLRAERAWQDELVQRLQLLGEVFANVLSRGRTELEMQRLRQELSHVARVSTVGELTTSLAHELNQPLTAILSNAQAAQRLLAAMPANLEEVQEILKDIVEDDKRASEVIHRLRSQPVDHLAGSLVILDNILQDLLHLFEVRRHGREKPLCRLRIAEDRGQGLVQLMSQRRGEFADRRHPGDVAQLLAEPLHLQFRPPARQDIGEDLAEELEPLHELVLPRALGPEGAEGERPHDPARDLERDVDLRLDTQPEVCPSVQCRFLLGELLDPREANHFTLPQPGHHPRQPCEANRRRRGRRPLRHPCVRDLGGLAVRGELCQAAPIDLEEVDDPAKALLDLAIHIGRQDPAERSRLLRQKGLEAQLVFERLVHKFAPQRAGDPHGLRKPGEARRHTATVGTF